mmetsp:Transcript_22906/g.46613  ORF Transcript_22906/g.46613 Transcript_22906/m.46613 type:complete len:408 (-) Transcript_22906:1203-2426(-)
MSISTSHDRLPQRLGQQILPRDDSDQLVVMIGDAKKSKTQRAKKSIRPLNRSRFVDGIGSGIGIGPEVDPSLSIAGLEFDGFYRRIFRILPFDRFPLDERQESFGFQKSIGGVAILVVTEGPSIEQSAQHGATRGPIKDAGDRGIDDGKVAVRSIPQKIVNHADSFHGSKALDRGRHGLPGHDLVSLRHSGHLLLQQGIMLDVNRRIVDSLVEQIPRETRRHDGDHQRQHVLHISRGFQQNDRHGNGHAGKPGHDGRGAHEAVGPRIGEGSRCVIEHVEKVSEQSAEGRPGQERGDQQAGGDADAVDDAGQGDVGHEEEENGRAGEGGRVRETRLSEVEELSNRHVGVDEVETRDLVVLLTGEALKGEQFRHQFLLLIVPPLDVGREGRAPVPQTGHEKGHARGQDA